MEITLNTIQKLADMEPAGQYFVLEDYGAEGLHATSRHSKPHQAMAAAMESPSAGVCVVKLVTIKIEEVG